MKKVYVQKQVIGWEEYTYVVPDDFNDYESLKDDMNWTEWEYLSESAEETGTCEIYDENYKIVKRYD